MLELVKEEDLKLESEYEQINDGQNENVENIGKKIGIATKIRLDSPFRPDKYPPTYIWDDGNGRILKFKMKITKEMEKYLRHFGIFTKEFQLDEHRDIKTAKIVGIQVHITNNDYELEWINPPSDRRAIENYKDITRNLRSKGYKVERIGCKPICETKDNFDPTTLPCCSNRIVIFYIDEIATDLCSETKDPRRNMIIDIKEYKGEDWLIANAEWLGYDLGHAFAGRQTQEQAKRAAIRCSSDLCRNKANVCDTFLSVTPESTVPKVTGWRGSQPKNDIVIHKVKKILPKIETTISKIDDTLSPIVIKLSANIKPINKPIQPIITGDIDNEGKCSIGKIIPDCNVCEFGAYKENEWYCSKWFCVDDSCRFENREDQECKICGFTTNIKEIFLEHAKIHKDEDIIQQVMQKIRHDDFLKDDVEMCPCGCGYGRGKTRWYSKKEMII